MIQKVRTVDPFRGEWIERSLFANGELTFSDRLLGLSGIGKLVGYHESLDDIVRIAWNYADRLQRQFSVIDATPDSIEAGHFLSVGNYQMRGRTTQLSRVGDIPNAIQRRQVVEDYYMARSLGVPLYGKVRAFMGGVQWSFDRIVVPVRTRDASVLVSAFWHHDDLEAVPAS